MSESSSASSLNLRYRAILAQAHGVVIGAVITGIVAWFVGIQDRPTKDEVTSQIEQRQEPITERINRIEQNLKSVNDNQLTVLSRLSAIEARLDILIETLRGQQLE